jgi:signal transduction histidine kinase
MLFRVKVLSGVATACAVLLLVAVLSHLAATHNDEEMRWVNHTHLVLQRIEEVRTSVSDAETSQRGYILTGDRTLLEAYHTSIGQLNEGARSLRSLTLDNPDQQARLNLLGPLVHDKVAVWDERIGIRQTDGLEATVASMKADKGRHLAGQIRDDLAGMRAEETRLLALRSAGLEASSRRIRAVIIVGDGLGSVFLALAGLFVYQEMKKRRLAEAVVRSLNMDLEVRVAERTAELAERAQDLERSNQELQQFAYVASHDLQEPLRTISSFTQLLAKRYREKLDDKAREFIDFAVDGCRRMQDQINDLLTFSRVGTHGKPLLPVNSEVALDRVLKTFKVAIDESNAVITHDKLPVVLADEIQLCQLFQNLIGNALKFRAAHAPRIHVSAEADPAGWKISVRDNGIGIASEHRDRVFVIFQRLHTKREFPGTGIGLAICKKIAERHGGRIWFEPSSGGGTTFCFTIHAARTNVAQAGTPKELRVAASAH